MATDQGDDAKRLDEWLALLGGPGARPQGPEAREQAVAEMCSAGADRLFPLLVQRLTGPDSEARCAACEAVLRIDAPRAIELVLPLLDDPEVAVRWQASGCLHDFGDERTIGPLIRVLQGDPDAMVRGTAAYALGENKKGTQLFLKKQVGKELRPLFSIIDSHLVDAEIVLINDTGFHSPLFQESGPFSSGLPPKTISGSHIKFAVLAVLRRLG